MRPATQLATFPPMAEKTKTIKVREGFWKAAKVIAAERGTSLQEFAEEALAHNVLVLGKRTRKRIIADHSGLC